MSNILLFEKRKNVELVCKFLKQVGYKNFANFVKDDSNYLYPGVQVLQQKARAQNRVDIFEQLLQAGLIN